MITEEEKKMNMFEDMDIFDAKFRQWAKIDKDWQPKQIIDNEEN